MGLLKSVYHFGTLPPAKRDKYQKIIRDFEWNSLVPYIPKGASFLDVGCGAGYNMLLAKKSKSCDVTGVDPNPYYHGVGRVTDQNKEYQLGTNLPILKASSEELPFDDNTFDVVFSSHVLEHIIDKDKALKEMSRVLKSNGILIIGMPTSTMAWINLFSQILFTTHKRIAHIFGQFLGIIKTKRYRWFHLFIPRSHSFSSHTIFYDLHTYKISNWSVVLGDHFKIEKVIQPALYPYPDFLQPFSIRKHKKLSSSVFFICSQKNA